jgi:hypothetical protein
MRAFSKIGPIKPRPGGACRLLSDERGSTAIEFGMIGLPFLLFMLAILGYGLYFLNTTYLQYGADTAARQIRTGQFNTGGAKGAMTVKEFREAVCKASKPVIDCSKLSVLVQHGTNWSGLQPQSCSDGKGGLAGSTGSENEQLSKYAGTSSEVVLVTLCYKWDLAKSFSFLKLDGGTGNGAAIIQAATAFKSEPYN